MKSTGLFPSNVSALACAAVLAILSCGGGQKKSTSGVQYTPLGDGKAVSLTGKLVQKPWRKATQSYCAGGSEYLVLEVDGKGGQTESEILSFPNQSDFESALKRAGKRVTLTGIRARKSIPQPTEPHAQYPSSHFQDGWFHCQVFRVAGLTAG